MRGYDLRVEGAERVSSKPSRSQTIPTLRPCLSRRMASHSPRGGGGDACRGAWWRTKCPPAWPQPSSAACRARRTSPDNNAPGRLAHPRVAGAPSLQRQSVATQHAVHDSTCGAPARFRIPSSARPAPGKHSSGASCAPPTLVRAPVRQAKEPRQVRLHRGSAAGTPAGLGCSGDARPGEALACASSSRTGNGRARVCQPGSFEGVLGPGST